MPPEFDTVPAAALLDGLRTALALDDASVVKEDVNKANPCTAVVDILDPKLLRFFFPRIENHSNWQNALIQAVSNQDYTHLTELHRLLGYNLDFYWNYFTSHIRDNLSFTLGVQGFRGKNKLRMPPDRIVAQLGEYSRIFSIIDSLNNLFSKNETALQFQQQYLKGRQIILPEGAEVIEDDQLHAITALFLIWLASCPVGSINAQQRFSEELALKISRTFFPTDASAEAMRVEFKMGASFAEQFNETCHATYTRNDFETGFINFHKLFIPEMIMYAFEGIHTNNYEHTKTLKPESEH